MQLSTVPQHIAKGTQLLFGAQRKVMDKFSWKMVVNPVYWLAFIIFIGREARKRTYKGLFPALVTVPLGIGFFVAALIATQHLVGTQLGIGWYGWLPASLIAASLTSGYFWPIAYSIADIIGDGLGHITKPFAEWFVGPVIAALRKLPLASLLWRDIEGEPGKPKRKWFTNFLMGATYIVGTLACAYCGYLSTEFLHAWLAGTFLSNGVTGMVLAYGWIPAGLTGVIVTRLLWQPLHDTLDKTEANGLAFIWSIIVGYQGAIALSGYVPTILGSVLYTQIAVGLVVFVLNAAVAFPLLMLIFNDGLKKLGDLLKPVLDKFYGADKNDFRLWFHHVVNILVAMGLAVGAFILSGKLDWNIWLTGGFTALTLVCSYLGVVHVLKHNGGNGIIGFLSSLAVGFGAFHAYGAYLGWLGWLGGSIAGVLAAALLGLVILPLIYRGLELSFGKVFKSAGESLDALHKSVSTHVEDLYKAVFKKAQDATFHDKTPFKALFGQVSNVLFAGGVLAAGYFYGLPHVGGPILYWLAVVATVLVSFTCYLVGGKLAKNDGGEPLIALICVGAALWVGGNAFSLLPWAWYFAIPTAVVLALIAGYGLGLFIIPPVYAGLKWLVLQVPDKEIGWKHAISTTFELVHKVIYEKVDALILKPLEGVIEAVAKFLAPIIAAVARAYKNIMDRVDRIFKRGKSA